MDNLKYWFIDNVHVKQKMFFNNAFLIKICIEFYKNECLRSQLIWFDNTELI